MSITFVVSVVGVFVEVIPFVVAVVFEVVKEVSGVGVVVLSVVLSAEVFTAATQGKKKVCLNDSDCEQFLMKQHFQSKTRMLENGTINHFTFACSLFRDL